MHTRANFGLRFSITADRSSQINTALLTTVATNLTLTARVSASVPSPFVLSSPRSNTNFPLRNSFATASTVNFLVLGGKSHTDGKGSCGSTPTNKDGSRESTSQEGENGSGNSSNCVGKDTSSSGPQDKGDSDDDDDDPKKSGRESFKDTSFSPDQDNKDEESEPPSKESSSSNHPTSSYSEHDGYTSDQSLSQGKNNFLTSTLASSEKLEPNFGSEESEEDLRRRLTPTEDNISFCDAITTVRLLNTLPTITGLNDPIVRLRNLSSSPGYTSVSSGSDADELHRDIFHCKALFPTQPANILYWSTDSTVSFRKYGIHQREFCLFSSRYYPNKSWDTCDAKEFKEVPILLQCMNQIIRDHRIDENPSLNSCLVEKIKMNEHTPESTVFPPELDSYAEENSALAILCLGEQNAGMLSMSYPRHTPELCLIKLKQGGFPRIMGQGYSCRKIHSNATRSDQGLDPVTLKEPMQELLTELSSFVQK